MRNPGKIKLIQYDWYLIFIEDDSIYFSPSGFLICQYIDNLFFDQSSETIIEKGIIIKKLNSL